MKPFLFTPHRDQFIEAWDLHTAGLRTIILVDSHTLEHCFPVIAADHQDMEIIEVDPGEDSKTWTIAGSIIERLLEMQADKHSVLVSLGGGMITDLGGFVGSTFKRGMRTLHVPTSLLGMVDAAIGGKNGLNVNQIKNAVGTITPPEAILIHAPFLDTLPEEEIHAGLGEMLKHAIISGESHWRELIHHWHDKEQRPKLIEDSAQIKWKIVAEDPYEQGIRQQLNLGHSVGHAIESATLANGRPIPHGIAVAVGLIIESAIAAEMNLASVEFVHEVKDGVLRMIPLPTTLPSFSELSPFLYQDKKNAHGAIKCSLPLGFGRVKHQIEVDIACMQKTYNNHIQHLFSHPL